MNVSEDFFQYLINLSFSILSMGANLLLLHIIEAFAFKGTSLEFLAGECLHCQSCNWANCRFFVNN